MEKPTLRGRLESFRLYDLLTLLNISNKSGTLVIEEGSKETRIIFRKGALRFAHSNQERFRLGAILREKKRLTTVQSAEIARIMDETSEKFGEIAVQTGTFTEDEVEEFLKVQVSEIVYDAFVWSGGDFFFVDTIDMPEWAVEIIVDISNLIMEGARRIDEWNKCLEILPDDEIVFRVIDNPEVQEKISLSQEEWKVLFHIDGRKSLKEISSDWGKDPLDLYCILVGLVANNLVEEAPLDEKTTVQQTPVPVSSVPTPTFNVPKAEAIDSTGPVTPLDFDEISDSQWKDLEDDTKLIIPEPEMMTYRDIMKVAVFQGRLTWKDPDGEKRYFTMVGDRYVVGRNPNTDIHIADSGVSSQHAEIVRTEDGYEIHDLGSHNGTWIDQARIEKKLLRGNDLIQIGRVPIQYELVYDVPEDNEQ